MADLKIVHLYKGDKLEQKMEAFGKSMAKQQAEAHKIACSVLLHFGQFKDTRIVQRFLMLVPDMVRTNGLRAWFEAHAALRFIVDESGAEPVEQCVYVKDKWKDHKEAIKLGEAITKPFWKFKAVEGKPYQPINEAEYVSGIIQRLRQDTVKTGNDHTQLLKALEMYNRIDIGALPVLPADDPLSSAPIPAPLTDAVV